MIQYLFNLIFNNPNNKTEPSKIIETNKPNKIIETKDNEPSKETNNSGIWQELPNELYIIGDIHGDFFTLKQSLELTGCVTFDPYEEELKHDNKKDTYYLNDGCKYYTFEKRNIHWNPTKTNCFIVFTGDIIDRCRPNMSTGNCNNAVNDENCDYQLLLLLINLDKEARKYNSRVIIILGNHELLHISEDNRYVSNKGLNDADRNNNINKLLIENINNLYGLIRINKYVIVHGGINDKFFEQVNRVLRKPNANIKLESIEIYNNYIRDYILKKLPNTFQSLNNNNIDLLEQNLNMSPFWDRTLGGAKELNDGQCRNIFENNILHINTSKELIDKLKIIVAHCPQFVVSKGINIVDCQGYEDKIYRIDVGMSRAFDTYADTVILISLLKNISKNGITQLSNLTEFFNNYNMENRAVSILHINRRIEEQITGELTLTYFYRISLNKNIRDKYLFLLSDIKKVILLTSNNMEIIDLINQIINKIK